MLELFGVDLSAPLTPAEWNSVTLCFQKRHLIAHKMAIIDDAYVKATNDPTAIVGRRIRVESSECQAFSRDLERLAEHLIRAIGL